MIRIERQNDLEFKLAEEAKKASQLAEDNKVLLEKIQMLEMDKTELMGKVEDMEQDNLNLMK